MKLRKLVLNGFKSFADRTEFEFHDGVSCVVGPNGCGKSNIVDAVKWVLGEQSAKSLRGSEMMDVIFNGSSARKPSSSAEVTLVFDNEGGLLKPVVESDKPSGVVSVTRRLFRSGQSEYLINKAAARLRDIREMFMDTGIGVDAYSLIEQGRVEGFLQASQDDRRAVFDEAAGISKYKARRKEALRKLERVDQNLLRLNDILAEVEKRLRSIKYQAGKARSYQGYTERLKELRSLHLMAQYHALSGTRTALRGKLDAGTDQLGAVGSQIEKLETTRNGTEMEAADLERSARELEGRIAAAGGMITASIQRAEMLESRVKELAEQIASGGAKVREIGGKIEACAAELLGKTGQLDQIEAQIGDLSGKYEHLRAEHTEGEMAVNNLSAALEDEKAGTIDLLRRTAQLHNEIQGLNIRRENLSSQKSRLAGRAQEIAGSLEATLTERSQYQARLADVQELLSATRARHEEIKSARAKTIDSENTLQKQLSQAREHRSGVLSRRRALEEMQQRLEGVGAGVRRVLQARAKGQLDMLLGMLGDHLETDTSHSSLVEAALCGADQQLVARSLREVDAAAAEFSAVLGENGSVEILCLDRLPAFKSDFDLDAFNARGGVVAACATTTGVVTNTATTAPTTDVVTNTVTTAPGTDVVANAATTPPNKLVRLMDYVRCDVYVAPAVWRLLGTTLIAPTLSDAAAAADELNSRDGGCAFRFVTASGEVLEADGRVRLGSSRRAAGVIARRSELAELAAQQRRLDEQIEALDTQCKSARTEREHLEELDQSLRQAIYEANTERVEIDSRLHQVEEQVAKLQREQPLVAKDIDRLAAEIDASVQSEHQAVEKAKELEALNAQRQAEVERLTERISAARARQGELTAQLTELKVALAGSQQRKLAVMEQQAALARQREALEKDLASLKSQLELNEQRKADAEAGITSARCEAQRLQVEQESLRKDLAEVEESRKGVAEKLEQIRVQLGELRKAQEEASAAVNACKVELSEVDVRIETLIARASEEMGMNLLERHGTYQHDENRDWAAVEAEIGDLRAKIERLGNVNLDAIAEQEELEKREKFLTEQLDDIRKSQQQLDDLIKRINKDSKERFVKSFEAIRANFQELFRKLFGGGKADILLANPDDVLESSIDILARPPGKETKSLSLLSGGEKTMTALALLFSIFRSRPSPFCLLDEVDAALDEANNRRFSTLVSDFVSTSQFIVISHSKRTMSMANVLYGVTMQEPGVSKRISVKFEEVGQKDGQLEAAQA